MTFQCRPCGRATSINASRLFNASFLRCDKCFAISTITPSQRLEMVKSAASAPSPHRGLLLKMEHQLNRHRQAMG
jgi:hypothetical protein